MHPARPKPPRERRGAGEQRQPVASWRGASEQSLLQQLKMITDQSKQSFLRAALCLPWVLSLLPALQNGEASPVPRDPRVPQQMLSTQI